MMNNSLLMRGLAAWEQQIRCISDLEMREDCKNIPCECLVVRSQQSSCTLWFSRWAREFSPPHGQTSIGICKVPRFLNCVYQACPDNNGLIYKTGNGKWVSQCSKKTLRD